jgi:O-antigen ligase
MPILSWEQLGRWLERLYVVLMLVGLTQGPVLQLWWTGARAEGLPVKTAIVATYLVLQLPAVFIFAYQRFTPRLLRGPIGALTFFVSWMIVTTVWATLSSHTIVEVLSLATTCVAGLYLAVRFSVVDKMILVCMAMQICVIWSYVAIQRNWSGSVGPFGEWIGIYYNRNSLAPVATVGALSALVLLWMTIRNKVWPLGLGIALLLVDIVVFNVFVLLKTESETTLYAGVIAVGAWLLISGWLALHRRGLPTKVLSVVWMSVAAVVLSLPWVLVFGIKSMGGFLERFGIGGREGLWVLSYDGFLQKPWFGWGWMSAWETPNFLPRELWNWQRDIAGPWSHSSFYDILLGGGLIAVALFMVVLLWTMIHHASQLPLMHVGQTYTVFGLFVLFSSTQESFIVGNHFLMVIFIAGLFGPVFDSAVRSGVIAGPRTAG